jgi:hypothetical protein
MLSTATTELVVRVLDEVGTVDEVGAMQEKVPLLHVLPEGHDHDAPGAVQQTKPGS